MRAENLCVDFLQHAVDILDDLAVPDSNNAKALIVQPARASFVAPHTRLIAMLRAIEFDEQMRGHAREISNVRTDRNLSPEMRTLQREFLQMAPEPLLCLICSVTKPT